MNELKLWLLYQSQNNGYDTYDSVVVAAYTEDEARLINPEGERGWGSMFSGWCEEPEQVNVTYLGMAAEDVEPGIILSSFNAG